MKQAMKKQLLGISNKIKMRVEVFLANQ